MSSNVEDHIPLKITSRDFDSPLVNTRTEPWNTSTPLRTHPISDSPIASPSPYPNNFHLSIVLTFRLDGYGAHLEQRAGNHIGVLHRQLTKHASLDRPVEIIIVEWGWSPEHASVARFVESLGLESSTKPVFIRVIRVPREVTERKDINPHNLKYLEFHAKNVGIRRARGKFILACNPDDLFKGELVRLMTSSELEKDVFYRTALVTLNVSTPDHWDHPKVGSWLGQDIDLPPNPSADQLFHWLEDGRFEYGPILGGWGYQAYVDVCTKRSEAPFNHSRVPMAVRNRMYLPAAGDFLLAHRNAWDDIGGYPEIGVGNVDSVALCMMHAMGYHQIVVVQPCVTIHQKHEVGRNGRNTFPRTLAACECFVGGGADAVDQGDRLRFERCYRQHVAKELPSEDWGMATGTFEDIVVRSP